MAPPRCATRGARGERGQTNRSGRIGEEPEPEGGQGLAAGQGGSSQGGFLADARHLGRYANGGSLSRLECGLTEL